MKQKELAKQYGVCSHTIRRWRLSGAMVGDTLLERPSPAWNKGKGAFYSEEHRLALAKGLMGNKNSLGHKHSEATKALVGRSSTGRRHSADTKRKLSLFVLKTKHIGGYTRGSGRGKNGYVRGIWCDSSWEAAFVVWHLDQGIQIFRNKDRFPYIFEGKKSNFLPDFWVSGVLVEIKGVFTKKELTKLACVSPLKVIGEEGIQKYLDYAKSKYGTNFTEKLYSEDRQI